MAAYVKMAGVDNHPPADGRDHDRAAATIMLAKMFVPETEKPATAGRVE